MKKTLGTIAAIIGGIVAVAGIAAAVYYFFKNKTFCCGDCDCDCDFDCENCEDCADCECECDCEEEKTEETAE